MRADEDIAKTLAVYEEAMRILKKAIEKNNTLKYLEGGPVHPVFRKIS